MQLRYAIPAILLLSACKARDHHGPEVLAIMPSQPIAGAAAHGGGGTGVEEIAGAGDAPPAPTPPQPPVGVCPAVGCGRWTAEIKADLQITFAEAKSAEFTLCRSEICLKARLPADAMQPMKAGLSVRIDAQQSATDVPPTLRFVSDGLIGVHIELSWPTAYGATSDRYRVSVTLADGHTRRLVDTTVMYGETFGGCGSVCRFGDADLRGQAPLDPVDDADGGI
jgi:hypothetical protein